MFPLVFTALFLLSGVKVGWLGGRGRRGGGFE
jgi:hypothetical protein